MFELNKNSSLHQECLSIVQNEPHLTANLANLSSLIYHHVGNLNWCGFYLLDKTKNELVLGPFQGKPACIRIGYGKGVCGAAWQQSKVMLVDDVHDFPGHIACDANTRSELVIPIFYKNEFKGVLDLDSEQLCRFDQKMAAELNQICIEIVSQLFQ